MMTDRYSALTQLQKLRAFAAVSEHGNVHRAGEALHLSQPAVTRAVRHLEEAIGVALFERTTKGMELTAAGRCVQRRAQSALGELHLAGTEILKLAPTHERLSTTVTEGMLTSLMAIASGGSEAAAAKIINLSQPAINRNLRRLEYVAGAALYSRSGRGTRLTEAGEVLVRHAKLAFAEIRVAAEELASMQGNLDGHIVIGALPLSSGYLVPRAVDRTLRDHPGLSISIVDGTYETLSHGLRCAEVSLIVGALRSAKDESYSIHEPLFEDSLSVIARTDHPVLQRATPAASLRDLMDESWVTPLRGTPGRAVYESAFEAESVAPPRTQLEANSPSIVRSLLLSSDRLALLSTRQVQQELRQGILIVVPVAVKQTRRTIGLTRLRGSEPSPGLMALIQSFQALFK
jgi:LysR family transcriptional regulator of gallate degradation